MRSIALVLLVVAARAVESKEHKSSVKLYDNDDRIVGAINFFEEDLVEYGVSYLANMWGIPDGRYVAAVHTCLYRDNRDICKSMEAARARLDTTEDLTKRPKPLSLFRQEVKSSTGTIAKGFNLDISLIPGTDKNIANSIIAIYRDTANGLQVCSKLQKTVKPVAWGFVEPTIVPYDAVNVPLPILDIDDGLLCKKDV